MAHGFDLKTFLLSPEGRVGRSPYFSFNAIVAMYSGILAFGIDIVGPSSLIAVAVVAMTALTAWSRYCVTVKRLQDIGWPKHWALVQFAPDILAAVTIATGLPWLSFATRALTLVVWVAVFVLIVTPGAKTDNRNGAVIRTADQP